MKIRFLTLLALAFVAVAMAVPTLAHEPRVVGPYQLAFGWRTEPAYTHQMNGPEVFVSLAPEAASATADATATVDTGMNDDDQGAPISADVAIDLKVEVSFGGQSMTIPMRPAWGEVGHLVGDLIPTRPGDYSFHVTGMIGDTPVDETFTSADGQFGTVEPVEDIMFPKAP